MYKNWCYARWGTCFPSRWSRTEKLFHHLVFSATFVWPAVVCRVRPNVEIFPGAGTDGRTRAAAANTRCDTQLSRQHTHNQSYTSHTTCTVLSSKNPNQMFFTSIIQYPWLHKTKAKRLWCCLMHLFSNILSMIQQFVLTLGWIQDFHGFGIY